MPGSQASPSLPARIGRPAHYALPGSEAGTSVTVLTPERNKIMPFWKRNREPHPEGDPAKLGHKGSKPPESDGYTNWHTTMGTQGSSAPYDYDRVVREERRASEERMRNMRANRKFGDSIGSAVGSVGKESNGSWMDKYAPLVRDFYVIHKNDSNYKKSIANYFHPDRMTPEYKGVAREYFVQATNIYEEGKKRR